MGGESGGRKGDGEAGRAAVRRVGWGREQRNSSQGGGGRERGQQQQPQQKWKAEDAALGEEEETFSEHLPAVEQNAENDIFIGRFLSLFVINPHAPTDWCVCARAFLPTKSKDSRPTHAV